jgi:hypothetical protein
MTFSLPRELGKRPEVWTTSAAARILRRDAISWLN